MQSTTAQKPVKRVQLKIQSATKTKRLRDIPENFEALKKLVEAFIADQRTQPLDAPKSGAKDYSITYVDLDQEKINISDDEDLLTAYDVAENELNGNLKFQVELKKSLLEKDQITASEKSGEVTQKKFSQMKDLEEEKVFNEGTSLSSIQEVPHTKPAYQTATDQDDHHDSSSDDEGKHHKKKRKGKKKKAEKNGLPPRKALKKLVMKELDQVAGQIFEDLINCKELGKESNAQKSESSPNTVCHPTVACDGCGVTPILGVRFKCSVCKNFDFCELCEERREHPHPFIKINRPEDAPVAILTVLREDAPFTANENGEQHSSCHQQDQQRSQNSTQPQSHHHHHGHRHRSHHHGHHQDSDQSENPYVARGGCGWRHHHRGGRWKEFANQWLNMATQVANQFAQGMTPQADEETKGEEGQFAGWKFGGDRCKWGEKRAVVVRAPQEPVEGEPGSIVMIEIEVQNQTKWPWKRGCFVAQLDVTNTCPLKVNDIPIDFEVRGMQTFRLCVPVIIPEQLGEQTVDTYQVELQFYGPKGSPFGQKVTLPVKVNDSAFELRLYKAAINLQECGLATFDEAVDALRKCNGDENSAVEMIMEAKKKEQESSFA